MKLRLRKAQRTINFKGFTTHSQRTRHLFQFTFVGLNLWLGIAFYNWVRFYETSGSTPFANRPPGVEGWLPVASLMGLKYVIQTGLIPEVHPAGIFLLVSFLLISLLFRKAFCSWLCPIGTLSEYLWKLGRKLFRNYTFPRWLDVPLRGLKYALLGLFVYVIGSMSIPTLEAFLAGPYGLIADVKMLNFFRFMSISTAATLSILAVLSIFVSNFWCRYLCPYGALMGLFALASPIRIERDPTRCIECGMCSTNCPSNLSVGSLGRIRSAECTACLECVDACPEEGALQPTLGLPISNEHACLATHHRNGNCDRLSRNGRYC